jgi:hypothetical protein
MAQPFAGGQLMGMGRRIEYAVGGSGLLVFFFLAAQVASGGQLATSVDPAVSNWMAAHRSAAVTLILMLLTHVHSTVGIDVMAASAALYMGRARHRVSVWPFHLETGPCYPCAATLAAASR